MRGPWPGAGPPPVEERENPGDVDADSPRVRSHRRSEERFSSGRARTPYKRSWSAGSPTCDRRGSSSSDDRSPTSDRNRSPCDRRPTRRGSSTSDDRFDPEASSDSGSDSDDSSGDIWLSGDDQHGENENEGFQMDVRDRECPCRTVLVVHAEAFRSMKRQGGDLKKRCKYTPKGDKDGCYRDINQQNDWLLSNVFDASGNYLYCCTCVQSILVSRPRLARLRLSKA